MAAIKFPIVGRNATSDEYITEPTHRIDLRNMLKYKTMTNVFLVFPYPHIQVEC